MVLANFAGRPIEHPRFLRFGGFPLATERPLKRSRVVEHAVHVGHPGHVPLREVAVKR